MMHSPPRSLIPRVKAFRHCITAVFTGPCWPRNAAICRGVFLSALLLAPELTWVSLTSTAHGQVFRLPDDRPRLDPQRLETFGLQILESKRLVLVTDLPIDSVGDLPPLADALFEELEHQLGPLAPNVAGTDFQVTGFLIDAMERFEKASVLPPEEFQIRHGRHLGYRFWMNNQTSAYYRRHLLLHEFVHCFTMCEHGGRDIPPLWYTEGIAEYFATHQLDADISKSQFGILPDGVDGFEGWGRIASIRQAYSVDPNRPGVIPQPPSLERFLHPADNSFTEELQYAQAWAIVWLIRHHPELKTEFAAFSPIRTRQDFLDAEQKVPDEVWKRMAVIWPLFLDCVIEGFDNDRSFPELNTAFVPWSADRTEPLKVTVEADKDWQPARVLFAKGQTIMLKCTGRFVMHDEPRAWISEPQGITIDYYQGRPLGEVVAKMVSPDGQSSSQRIPVGTGTSITFPHDAELWLQVNDSAALRAGNSGTVEVRIE